MSRLDEAPPANPDEPIPAACRVGDALSALLFARMTHKPFDAGELARLTTEAVAATG